MQQPGSPRGGRLEPTHIDPSVDTRVGPLAPGDRLQAVVAVLRRGRDEALRRWLEAARQQPFHAGRPEAAIADSVTDLFDALVAFLDGSDGTTPPMADPAIRDSALAHARARFSQGLTPAELLTEFRLLRQEIGRLLHQATEDLPNVLAAELLINDALDGAATVGLVALDAHQAEQLRLRAELQLRSELIQQAQQAIFAWPVGGGISLWNRGAEEMYGYTPEEALGRISHDLLETPRDQVERFLGVLDQAGRWEGELSHRTKDGRRITVEARTALIETGGQQYVLEVTRDVTERRRIEAERELLLGAVAHDLKTPLAAIKGSADLLQRLAGRERLTPEQVVNRTSMISTAVASMAAQIDQLLDAARLRAGEPIELVRRPTDLVALARRVVEQMRQTSGCPIAFEAAVPELVGAWDPARLERVLGNLLNNAIKYSPAEAEIRVGVDAEQQAGQTWACVTVQDRGVGIPAADLPRIFERYHRARNVVGRFHGEGIGLAGAKQVIEQHGGTIGAESREGEGSTFSVRLPLVPPPSGDERADG